MLVRINFEFRKCVDYIQKQIKVYGFFNLLNTYKISKYEEIFKVNLDGFVAV